MVEKLSNYFNPEITPDENNWTGNFKLIKSAKYAGNKNHIRSYLHTEEYDEIWNKEEANNFYRLCIKLEVKSVILETMEKESEINSENFTAQ